MLFRKIILYGVDLNKYALEWFCNTSRNIEKSSNRRHFFSYFVTQHYNLTARICNTKENLVNISIGRHFFEDVVTQNYERNKEGCNTVICKKKP